MNKELLRSVLTFSSAIAIILLVIFVANQETRVDIPEIDETLCPKDKHLINSNRLIIFDFSDPLPEQYLDYPQKIINHIIRDTANQFDRIKLYTFNPDNPVPVKLSDFCIPFTIKSIPEEERKVLWGRDPDLSKPLPSRFKKHRELIERMWIYEKSLEQNIEKLIRYLADKGTESQPRSKLIETIEELVAVQKEEGSQKNTLTILSDMLQNTDSFSHYKEGFDLAGYLGSRPKELIDMSGFVVDVHYLQTCKTMAFEDRKNHKDFWKGYFARSGVDADFELLPVDDIALKCKSKPARNKRKR